MIDSSKKGVEGLYNTGIPELDEKMLGICKGYLTLIQAESGLGKTEFVRYLEHRLGERAGPTQSRD